MEGKIHPLEKRDLLQHLKQLEEELDRLEEKLKSEVEERIHQGRDVQKKRMDRMEAQLKEVAVQVQKGDLLEMTPAIVL